MNKNRVELLLAAVLLLACVGWQHLRMCVLAGVVAKGDAHVVYQAGYNRQCGFAVLFGYYVLHRVAAPEHQHALFADFLPWLCLHHPQHSVHGVVVRSDGFQPFLSGA